MEARPGDVDFIEPGLANAHMGNFENIIAVMGVTGSGKSTLVKNITGRDVVIGHDLESCTASVTGHQFELDNNIITLIDTPGFDDSKKSDTEILQDIHAWLAISSRNNIKPRGIIYLHKVDDNRMYGSSIKYINIFEGICGSDALKNVVLVTTMWGMGDKNVEEDRHEKLCNNYWKMLTVQGAKTAKYSSNEVIINIIRDFVNKDKIDLQIVRETTEGRSLGDTSAGRVINKELIDAQEKAKEEIACLEKLHKKAIDNKNNESAEECRIEREKYKKLEIKQENDRKIMEKKHQDLIKAYNEKLKNLEISRTKKNVAKRVTGGALVFLGSALATVVPPLGIPVAIFGGGLIGSSIAPEK